MSGAEAEARKSTQGRRLVRERALAMGKDSIYNLTGLVRAFPLKPEDLPNLENQFTFYTHYLGRAEELALERDGPDLLLGFRLPPGSYATTVVEELRKEYGAPK